MRCLVSVLLLLLALPAHAAWLVGLPTDATRVDLASRDVPTTQLDFDGRAHGAIGGSLVIWQRDAVLNPWWEMQWQVFALAAADNGTSRGPWPTELARWQAGTRLWLRSPEFRHARLQFDVGALRQVATTLGSYTLPESPPTNGIAFGGGGYVLDLGVGADGARGPIRVNFRIGDRVHLPGWLALVGQRNWADVTGDALGDNLLHQFQLDGTLSVVAWPHWQPIFALHGDLLIPLDASSQLNFGSRYLLGVLHPLERGAILPFVSLDVGAGPGLLVNRNELRLGLGVRYVP